MMKFESIPVKGNAAIIIGTRHNPQLGSYLYDCIVGTIKRVGPKSKLTGRRTVKVDYNDFIDRPASKSFDDAGWEKTTNECSYGSMSYHMYLTKEAAIEHLTSWLNDSKEHRRQRAQSYIDKINAA